MAPRLILIALFLISASPKKADYERCVTIPTPPLDLGRTHPFEGDAPVSELASWVG
jgi:hypothetical protein